MTGLTLRIVIGTAGSGKSTIAQRLACEYGAAYLDKDAMSARFVEAALLAAGYDPGDRESNAYYRERILPLEYDSLLDVAGANLRVGRPVVIDAPFSPCPIPTTSPRPRIASTGRLSTSRCSACASPRRHFNTAYGSAASSGTPTSSPTGTSTGRRTGGKRARGQAFVFQSSRTT
jgi:AAA domain